MSGKKACPLGQRQISRDFAHTRGLWRQSAQATVCGADVLWNPRLVMSSDSVGVVSDGPCLPGDRIWLSVTVSEGTTFSASWGPPRNQ